MAVDWYEQSDAGPPDWSRIAEDWDCPRCGYILRGLERPLCPECGLQFEWAIVLDRRRRDHRYLYEHHNRRRRIRRFITTSFVALRPWAFWRDLHLEQRSYGGRLGAFFALSLMLVVLALLVRPGVRTVVAWRSKTPLPPRPGTMWGWRPAPRTDLGSYIKHEFTLESVFDGRPGQWWGGSWAWRSGWRCRADIRAYLFAWYLVLPLASTSALMVYWRSRKRFRILSHHLWRCGIYAWAASAVWMVAMPLMLLGGAMCVYAFVDALTGTPAGGPVGWGPQTGWMGRGSWIETLSFVAPQLVVWWGLLALGHFWVSLWIAGRRYVRFERGWTVAFIAAQVLLLAVFCNLTLLFLWSDPQRMMALADICKLFGW